MSSFKNNVLSWVVDIIYDTKLCLLGWGGGGIEKIWPCGIYSGNNPLRLYITCPSIRDKYILSLNK